MQFHIHKLLTDPIIPDHLLRHRPLLCVCICGISLANSSNLRSAISTERNSLSGFGLPCHSGQCHKQRNAISLAAGQREIEKKKLAKFANSNYYRWRRHSTPVVHRTLTDWAGSLTLSLGDFINISKWMDFDVLKHTHAHCSLLIGHWSKLNR